MSDLATTTDTASEARPVPRWRLEEETYLPRIVDREISPWLHVEHNFAANFRGDVELMLQIGEHFGLTERDFRFLHHVLKTAVRHAERRGDCVVLLSDRQWNIFKAIRRKFIRSYRNPMAFMAYAQATRNADAQSITAASSNQN